MKHPAQIAKDKKPPAQPLQWMVDIEAKCTELALRGSNAWGGPDQVVLKEPTKWVSMFKSWKEAKTYAEYAIANVDMFQAWVREALPKFVRLAEEQPDDARWE